MEEDVAVVEDEDELAVVEVVLALVLEDELAVTDARLL